MEPAALAALMTAGIGATDLEPPAVGPRLPTSVRGSVAVIPLIGVIMPWKAAAFADAVRAAAANDDVGAIVAPIDSPGGVVTGVPEAADVFFGIRQVKPTISVVTGMMASAGYWIGSGAATVIASPSAYAGSIGVWTMHADLSKMLEDAGVKISLISAGKYKVEGNFFEPLSDQARAAIQTDVEDVFDLFTTAVARHRGVSATAVRGGYGEGRVLNAQRAKAAHLVDRIDTLDAVLTRLTASAKASSTASGRRAEVLRRRLALDASA